MYALGLVHPSDRLAQPDAAIVHIFITQSLAKRPMLRPLAYCINLFGVFCYELWRDLPLQRRCCPIRDNPTCCWWRKLGNRHQHNLLQQGLHAVLVLVWNLLLRVILGLQLPHIPRWERQARRGTEWNHQIYGVTSAATKTKGLHLRGSIDHLSYLYWKRSQLDCASREFYPKDSGPPCSQL